MDDLVLIQSLIDINAILRGRRYLKVCQEWMLKKGGISRELGLCTSQAGSCIKFYSTKLCLTAGIITKLCLTAGIITRWNKIICPSSLTGPVWSINLYNFSGKNKGYLIIHLSVFRNVLFLL